MPESAEEHILALVFHLTKREPEPALDAGGSPPLHLTFSHTWCLTLFLNTRDLTQSLQPLALTAHPEAEKYLLTPCDDITVLLHGTKHVLKTTIMLHVHVPVGQL